MVGDVLNIYIDGDPVVYAAGHAVGIRTWYLQWWDDGPRIARFHSAWRRDEFIRLMNLHPDEYVSFLVVNPGPLSHSLAAVKRTLTAIVAEVSWAIEKEGREVGEVYVFLSGPTNFRDRIATMRPYKGNRDPASRPVYYDEMREYMVQQWGAFITNGWEADDELAIMQTANPGVIVSDDKDLMTVKGWHWRKGEFRYIYEDEAELNFYRQLLSGDSSDNIGGVPGVGEAGARRVLPNDAARLDEFEKFDRVLLEYLTKGLDVDHLLENARLLHMLRHEDDLWYTPYQRMDDNPGLRAHLESLPPLDPDEDLT